MAFSLKTLGKWLLVTAVLGIGVAGGSYIGYGWAIDRAEHTAELESRRRAAGNAEGKFLTVGNGDLFPIEYAVDSSGEQVSFSDLIKDRDVIVIFADWQCDACLKLLRFVQSDVIPSAQQGVRFVVVSKTETGSFPSVYAGLLNRASVVYIDGETWARRYRLTRWPTIVGVDFSGFITHVQIGFSGAIDHELVDRFLSIR